MTFWIYAFIEERWRSPEVLHYGRFACKQENYTAEAKERSRTASLGRLRATAKICRCQGRLTHLLAHFHSCAK